MIRRQTEMRSEGEENQYERSCSRFVLVRLVTAAIIMIVSTSSSVEASTSSSSSSSILGRQWSARHLSSPMSSSSSSTSSSKDYRYNSRRSSKFHKPTDKSILLAWGKKTQTTSEKTTPKSVSEMEDNEPSLSEMRAQLGPAGRAVASAVEVGVITAGSYLSGGILGYALGGVMGTPTLFKSAPPPTDAAVRKTLGNELKGRLGNWHLLAAKQAKSWAQLSAAFSGFHALTRNVRGGREDKWNSVIGSAATGAYLSRKGGPRSMIQSAATYAGFTYVLDQAFGGSSRDPNTANDEFDFNDAPVEERGF